jgi:hypothetical protein
LGKVKHREFAIASGEMSTHEFTQILKTVLMCLAEFSTDGSLHFICMGWRHMLARGLAMDLYAYPDIGVPSYSAIGPQIDRCIVYSIVRTESAFDQRDKSLANAVGLMQATPQAGRDTAKRFGVVYDWKRLVSDPVYNMQMGAAEIAALLKDYCGSYI